MHARFVLSFDLHFMIRDFLSAAVRCWLLRRPLRNRRRTGVPESLESRLLLTITALQSVVQHAESSDGFQATFTWHDPDHDAASHYEIWIDQNVSASARNSRVYYSQQSQGQGSDLTHHVEQEFSPGDYTVYLRRHEKTQPPSGWVRHTFQIDDDGDPSTPIVSAIPARADVTVVREGQAASGQTFSEGAINWIGDAFLYDAWLGKRSISGSVSAYSYVRNIPAQSISLRHLALASQQDGSVFLADLAKDHTFAQLETGDYEFYVRAVNGAADRNGRWIGRGPWSRGADFSFHRLEGADAVPESVSVTHGLRPNVMWSPVPHAEAYFLSFWKGPDYNNHIPLNVRVYGTQYSIRAGQLRSGNRFETINPGDEFFVRVRAIGSEGMLEGLRRGNYASAVIRIPHQLTLPAKNLTAPIISGPAHNTGDSMPVLAWQHAEQATTYDVWFTSLQTRTRMLLATGITDNTFHLSPESIARFTGSLNIGAEFDPERGLASGSYRFWVRARSAAAKDPGAWSRSWDFTVAARRVVTLATDTGKDQISEPLISPNLVETYVENGQQYLLISNGMGETFGASVLARFAVDDDGRPYRLRNEQAEGISGQLQFPDLPVGHNVSDMAFLDKRRLVVLSRGSNELRIIDLVKWQVVSAFAMSHGAHGSSPDAMDLEVLSNGQILVVFNRSNRLRIFDVDQDNQLREVSVSDSSETDQGFILPEGRAMQVSAVPRNDGHYLIFLATPGQRGIVMKTYDPFSRSLAPAVFPDGSRIPPITRSPFSGPYVGGRLKTVTDSEGRSARFYLSTDRNGFLTWVNTETFVSGFVDLVAYLPDLSRDPNAENYRNPNDNHVDPSRIVDFDDSHVVVLNNRARSVLLGLSTDSNGELHVNHSDTLAGGYGGDVIRTPSGIRIVTTYGGSFGIATGGHAVRVTDLIRDTVVNQWDAGESFVVTLAAPVEAATVVSDNTLLLTYSNEQRSLVHFDDSTNQLSESFLPRTYTDDQGFVYRDQRGPAGVHDDPATGRKLLVTRANRTSQSVVDDAFLVVIDITDVAQTMVVSVHQIDPQMAWYSVHVEADQIVVLDRLGAAMLSVYNWQISDRSEVRTFQFAERHGSTFGGSRPGRAAVMPDGTRVVMHDTTPDRVFSVFPPGSLLTESPVATVHANNIGQWIYDLQVVDADRVVVVTWDAVMAILNVRTGVFETVQQLDERSDGGLDLYGARDISVQGDRLSVSSPSSGTIATFRLSQNQSGIGYTATLNAVRKAPNAVTFLLTESAQWVVETDHVTRLALG